MRAAILSSLRLGSRRPQLAVRSAFLVAPLLLCVAPALAEEPRPAGEPRLMAEPAEVTQVADAFDDDDPFDLHLSLGYQYSHQSGHILREASFDAQGMSSGGYTKSNMRVANTSQTVNRLNTRADLGLYRDVALVIRMPIVLSDQRSLTDYDGSSRSPTVTEGAPGESLFSVPFTSPTRSGIEYLAVGLDVGVLNQYRDRTKPTWVIGVEGRFDVSTPMHACNAQPAAGQVKCAPPGDINRNGAYDSGARDSTGQFQLEASNMSSRNAGVSRGVTGLEFHTMLSRRYKYVEPYGGLRFLAEFPTSKSDYGTSDFKGSPAQRPPLVGTLTTGIAIIPWEVRDGYQRVTFDFRFDGTYRSEGRDYSELFDALGSSSSASLRAPNWAEYQAGPNGTSVVNPRSQKVYMTGLTDVQQHLSNRYSAQFTWQAGRYIKFTFGGALSVIQGHFITFDQACNSANSGDAGQSGPCRKLTSSSGNGDSVYTTTGTANPHYRPMIDAVGRRFRVADSQGFDAWLNATVMF